MKCRNCGWCDFDRQNPAKTGTCTNPDRKGDPYVNVSTERNCSYGKERSAA